MAANDDRSFESFGEIAYVPPPTHSVCALNYSRGACAVGLQHKIRLPLQLAAASARAGKQKQELFFRFRCWAGTFVGRSGGLKEGEGYGTRFPPSSLLLVSPSWANLHTVRRTPLGDGRLDGHFIGTFDYLADLMVCDLCRSWQGHANPHPTPWHWPLVVWQRKEKP